MQKVWIEPPEEWEPEIRFGDDHSRWAGTPRCLQWINKKGRQCSKPPMKGKSKKPHPAGPGWKRKCRSHGGRAVAGIAHPQYKTGRYGMDLGDERAKALDRLLSDEDLLSLNDNIAITDMRIIELVQSLIKGGNPAEMWKKVFRSWDLMWRATAREDSVAVNKHRQEVDDILRHGVTEIATWEEIDKLNISRMRLSDTEVKRREKMKYMVLVEDTLKDYLATARVVKETILDTDIPKETKLLMLKRIQSGLASVMSIAIPTGAETPAD